MGLFDKASEIVGGAVGTIPDVDLYKLRGVVDIVWNNRDELVDLLTRLPTLLGDAGEQMHAAGTGAQQAGDLLTGDLLSLTASAADALDACQKQLAQVGAVLGEIGRLLDRIPLMGNVTDPVSRGLSAVGGVADNLDLVSVQVRSIGAGLSGVGEGLDVMGGSLKGGGAALAAVSGRRVGEARAAAAESAAPVASTPKAAVATRSAPTRTTRKAAPPKANKAPAKKVSKATKKAKATKAAPKRTR